LIPRFAAAHTASGHARDEGSDVVDHEIDFVFTALLGWVDRDLRCRQREDQPALSDIDVRKAEHIAKEGAIGLAVRAVDNHVCAVDCSHSMFPYWCS
jgi:hypothetical protein